jgi:hypothetical protein
MQGGLVLVGLPGANLVDLLWGAQRPAVPRHPLAVHPLRLSGEATAAKLARVRAAVRRSGCASVVVAALDQCAWLFNLRGRDIACNPVFFAFAVVGTGSRAHLFLGRGASTRGSGGKRSESSSSGRDQDWSWLGDGVAEALAEAHVTLRPYSAFAADLPRLVAEEALAAQAAALPAAATAAAGPGAAAGDDHGETAGAESAAVVAAGTVGGTSAVGNNESTAASAAALPATVAVLVDKSCCSLEVAAAVAASGARLVEAAVSPSPLSMLFCCC